MTREEAREFLIDISYKLGNMSVEYLSEKDGKKMREAIEALEQEPKTGEWIEHFDESGKWYECDQCHTDWGGAVNFCPNCGADMRGEKA